jgi:YHS domain-containing protein
MQRFHSTPIDHPAVALRGILAICLAAAVSGARADVTWHDSLPTARAACTTSGRPVLAIFVASWSPEATRFREQTLASAEVKGLIEACFEATIIDVDANPALTRRMEVSHVPSACIFGEKGKPLASFECPEQPLAFVAAASKAAQEAAAVRATGGASIASAAADPAAGQRDLSGAGFASTPGDGDPLARPDATSPQQASGGSISLVTAKVRQLSDFASVSDPTAVPTGSIATATAAPPPAPSRFRPTPEPTAGSATLATAPPDWTASRPHTAATFTNAADPLPAARPSLEPAASTASTATAPWLGGQTAGGTSATAPLVPTEPESSATASDLAEPAPQKKTVWSSFVSAFTKPFTPMPTRAEPPPTMPPARPAMPVADAVAAAVVPPSHPEPVTPDPYGSMPLGLEGYCPVSLADRGVWTEGRAQWGVRHRGRTYLFAGPEQQQAFLASPDRYAPALSGDDPVVVVDQRRSTPGRRAYGVTYQSRMYLFSSPETRAQFAANPERYTAPVMLAERPAPPTDVIRRY